MAAFATHEDVARRLGRELTEGEQQIATEVIATVTGLICDEVDQTPEWAEQLDPVPAALKAICVEKAIGLIANPIPAIARQQLGSYTVTFARSTDNGLMLTEAEARMARQAVYGSLAGSTDPRSVIDRINDIREGRDPR